MTFVDTKEIKEICRNFYNFLYIDRWMFLFIFIGGLLSLSSLFFRTNLEIIALSYISAFIGVMIGFKKHPFGAMSFFFFVILITIISLSISYPSEIDKIVGLGVTSIIALITFWYSTLMYRQINIMNNEKKGKLIGEISRSIFFRLKNELMEFKRVLETGKYIYNMYPIEVFYEAHWKDLIHKYLTGEVEIRSPSSSSRTPIIRSAKRLLKINDDELIFTSLVLDKLTRDFNENYNELLKFHKTFDGDFHPYWIPFMGECKRLDQSRNFDDSYEADFKIVLKYTLIQKDYDPILAGQVTGHHEDLPNFIHENRDKLYNWLQNITILKEDIEIINDKKMKLIEIIDDFVNEIDYLISNWKITYYLTEEELQYIEA